MHGYEEQFVVQGMHMLFEGTRWKKWLPGERSNRLVFIGRGITKQEFREGFLRCRRSAVLAEEKHKKELADEMKKKEDAEKDKAKQT
eukprot:CAMPEP_0173387256 /NCGR_PEP_ID=MMETSP1356-20130122/9770_1 /TAXON_ID=77927 ORGANISM="Hemiselmis virescens, Strain PCC157" /NCGR_SAMPLE_ID=MMETSP1356 /ASSEMBLY_ACC=CAM_ASM_000847 /LENGTH=86 /DNA_ID=CAMNT_0014343785 /DNA_START=42 /DNA_END=302 /DNA_ORIENTATION=+